MTALFLRGCQLLDRSRVDVRVRGDRIVEVGPDLSVDCERVIDANGGALIPGLHDHHIHLFSLAAALNSVRCGPPDVRTRDELAAVLRAEPDWNALPASTPPRIRKLLRRCLERDRKQRLQAIGEARIANGGLS